MIRKLSIDELEPGMEVVRLSSEIWEHLPFLYTRPGVLQTEEQIESIRKGGYMHAFIQVRAVSYTHLTLPTKRIV